MDHSGTNWVAGDVFILIWQWDFHLNKDFKSGKNAVAILKLAFCDMTLYMQSNVQNITTFAVCLCCVIHRCVQCT
jgi:hypothetical protein